jgi:hypothetical protein
VDDLFTPVRTQENSNRLVTQALVPSSGVSTVHRVGSWDPMFVRFGVHETVMFVSPEVSGVAVTVL